VIILRCKSDERIEQLVFAPDGRGLVAVSQRVGVKVWDALTPNARPSRVLDYEVRAVCYIPDSHTLLVTGHVPLRPESQGCYFHDLRTNEVVLLPSESARILGAYRPTPDGRFLLVARNLPETPGHGEISCRALDAPTVPLWAVQTTHRAATPTLLPQDGRFFVYLEWDFDARKIARVIRETATGALIAESPHPSEYCDLTLSPTGQWLAGHYGFGATIFHGANFAARPIVLRNDTTKLITGLAFHPSGRYLAATSNDATVKLYDTETWKVAKVFTWEIGRMRSVAFSPDGMLAAAGGDKGQIIVWDFDL
jgi:WD40 repeat protein